MSGDTTRRYVVPGRVELVGKHVDYAGGRSLTCAVDRAITVHARALDAPLVRVRDHARRGSVEVPLAADVERRKGSPRWSSYVVAVARRFARDFPNARRGVELELGSTLPPSAGLSSSSAFVVGVASALFDANSMEDDAAWSAIIGNPLVRAEYMGAMETGAAYGDFPGDAGVGVRGGAQDHVAIVCAEEESVGQFSYRPARLERRVPWPAEYSIAIGVSGVTATKTGNARARYNRVSDSTRALVRAWNAATGRDDDTLAGALASAPDAGDRLGRLAEQGVEEFDGAYLGPRFAQFREEVEVVVPGVGDAMRDRDFTALGTLVDRSMAMAEYALRNQVAETSFLARSARERGAVAASAFGAGFGGAVWAMVQSSDADAFVDAWRAQYLTAFPHRTEHALWLVTRPGGPARAAAE
ncbi:MAG TPA: galactokinase family protein [Gemmatimonadaceae bacterium]|nr:galactokinase family protein [Gemmatimonadaceae bacterium]